MKRRGVLAALTGAVAGLAGCSATGDGQDGDRRTPYGVPTTTEDRPGADQPPPRDATRKTLTGLSPQRRLTLGVDPSTTVPEDAQYLLGFVGTATRDRPARVRIALTNVGARRRAFPAESVPPTTLRGRRVSGGDGGIVLVPVDAEAVPESPTGGCWQASRDPTVATSSGRTLDPDESVVREYALLRTPSDDPDCANPRRAIYRFGGGGVPTTLSAWDPRLQTAAASEFTESRGPLPGFDRTVWFHETSSVTPVSLRPTSERLAPGETGRFHLENFSGITLPVDPAAWTVYRLDGGDWTEVAADPGGAETTVAPGGRRVLELTVGTRSGEDETRTDTGTPTTSSVATPPPTRAEVEGLPAGTYALRYGRSRVDTDDTGPIRVGGATGGSDPGPETGYAALFSVRRPSRDVR